MVGKRIYSGIVGLLIVIAAVEHVNAQSDFKMAEWYYNDMQYQLAIPYYEKQISVTPTLEITEALADCYRLTGQYEKAEEMYRSALLIPYYSPSSVFYLAEVLRCNGKYKEAKTQYELYSAYVPEKKERMNELIASCTQAEEWLTKPLNVKVKNEKALNSAFSEWGIALTKKGIVFCSDRVVNNNTLIDGRTGASFYKLYFSSFSSKTSEEGINYSKPKLYDKSLNNEYHNASPSITPNEDAIYFSRVNYTPVESREEAEKYISRSAVWSATGTKKWQTPLPVLQSESAEYSFVHPFISEDGNTLYFASDKPGGYGSFDIYYCTKQSDKSWSVPVNAGPGVNTVESEGFPFMSGDSVLYFSSKGFIGMGGYDFFKSKLMSKRFIKAVNLGYPFNSSGDDISFYLMRDQKRGYFSSDRKGGMGNDDIYYYEKQ